MKQLAEKLEFITERDVQANLRSRGLFFRSLIPAIQGEGYIEELARARDTTWVGLFPNYRELEARTGISPIGVQWTM